LLLPGLSSAAEDDKAKNSQISLWTWNVWFDEQSAEHRFPEIMSRLHKASPDVVFLQEVTPSFISSFQTSSLKNEYRLYTTFRSRISYGLAFLTKSQFSHTKLDSIASQFNRNVFFALIEIDKNKAIVLINVHLESGQSEKNARAVQIAQIYETLLPAFLVGIKANRPELKVVGNLWAGDFNLDGKENHPYLSKYWQDTATKNENKSFELKTTYDVNKNPLAKKTAGLFEGSSRLDRVYLNNQSTLEAKGYQVLDSFNGTPNILSDHYPIKLDLTW
jgi:endonuclease/exonuclease/phosphatase family metal-dependent hydrolase